MLKSHEKEASLLLAEALEAFKEVAAIFNRVEEAASKQASEIGKAA